VKERLITLALAIGALLLFVAMFIKREGALGARNEVPRPTTAERRGNGYHAAVSWLEAEGLREISLRDRFDTLAKREDLPKSGNLLIVTLPASNGFNTWEFIPLDRWIRAGNTLLIVAALSDNPDWGFANGGFASGDLNLLTGLEFETAKKRDTRISQRARPAGPKGPSDAADETDDSRTRVADAFRLFQEPQRSTLVPNRPHAYFNGVQKVIALSDYPQQMWTVKVPYEGFVLSLAHEQEHGEGVLWTRPLGQGRIIVSGFGSIFTNRAIGLGDNAKLLANIVGVTVGEHGAVLFDDLHQGLGAAYDPDKFYRDKRLYITLGVLVALWLIWVLGSTRLRAPVPSVSTPREADLIRAAGGFFARALPSHAGARRLLDNFFRQLSARAGGRRDDSVPWDILERSPRVAAADVEQLRRWYAEAHSSRRVPLTELQNLIVRIDRQLAT
jgi:uncharacterized protein DUF4350